LRDAGVGSDRAPGRHGGWAGELSTRELEKHSIEAGGLVSKATLGRLIGPLDSNGCGYLCDEATFVKVIAALARAGVPPTTIATIKESYVTDKRVKEPTYRFETVEDGASAAELILSVVGRLQDRTERDRFLGEFAEGLPQQLRVELMGAMVTSFGEDGEGTTDGGMGGGGSTRR
jgi:hypothetical protein